VSTSPDLQSSIAVVRSEVQRGQQAVERFLRYIEPQSPLIIEVDVHKLLDDLFQILDRELLFRSISVRRVFQADLPTVRSDSSKLRQVFLNIVINAVEAIDKDGEITLTSEVVENGLAVTVSDNGPGISAADLKRIFEPLWTTRSQGTGLGLPLCRQILEKLDGEITIQSALGKGTVVTVTLPLRLKAQRIPGTTAES
jgi:two-component system NtrC family sensor kinase